MSLWRVKHTLSPVVEYALVIVAAAYGLFGIYLSSLRPFVVATTEPIASVSEPVPLDPALWTRHDDKEYGYAYAVPTGWLVDDSDPARVRIGRSLKEIGLAGEDGGGVLVEVIDLYDDKRIEDVAVSDFSGRRPALYDVAIDGRPALFAIDFENGRVARQVVYVPLGKRALVIRAARTDVAAFAMFISDLKFYSSD
jgi:hypothetical protein